MENERSLNVSIDLVLVARAHWITNEREKICTKENLLKRVGSKPKLNLITSPYDGFELRVEPSFCKKNQCTTELFYWNDGIEASVPRCSIHNLLDRDDI